MSDVETWQPIPSHPGYEASSLGQIRNARTHRVLKPQGYGSDYLKVHLGRRHQVGVHRLVCEAFHGSPNLPSDHADHLNFNRMDNRPENLRWLAAHLNLGRKVRYGQTGWELTSDEEQPDDHQPMTDAQRAEADASLSRAGW